jgi:transketolase
VAARVVVERASTFGCKPRVGTSRRIIGMETLGASVPLKPLQRKFGFEPGRIVLVLKELPGRVQP